MGTDAGELISSPEYCLLQYDFDAPVLRLLDAVAGGDQRLGLALKQHDDLVVLESQLQESGLHRNRAAFRESQIVGRRARSRGSPPYRFSWRSQRLR